MEAHPFHTPPQEPGAEAPQLQRLSQDAGPEPVRTRLRRRREGLARSRALFLALFPCSTTFFGNDGTEQNTNNFVLDDILAEDFPATRHSARKIYKYVIKSRVFGIRRRNRDEETRSRERATANSSFLFFVPFY